MRDRVTSGSVVLVGDTLRSFMLARITTIVVDVSSFFLVYSYSHATYVDHGGVRLNPVFLSAVRARLLVASSPSALRPALSPKK